MTKQGQSRLVNALTFARVPLIFAWAVLAVVHELAFDAVCPLSLSVACAACLMMLLSGLTDLWDGRLARRWQVVSTLGKMADPLMDKVFYIVAFPVLSWQVMHQGGGDVHSLVLVVLTVSYMLRDTWVTFMRSIGTMYGADVAAMWLGKVRTALSFPGAGWIYVYLAFSNLAPGPLVRPWLFSCYVVEMGLFILTAVSLVTYTRAYMPYLKRALERQ